MNSKSSAAKEIGCLDGTFDPYTSASTIAEVPGLRALHMSLEGGQCIDWHRSRSTTTLFANKAGLVVQIQRPPFRCVLQAGEFYTVPPGVDMTVYSNEEAPLGFTVFQYGESLDATPSEQPTLAYVGERTEPPAHPPRPRSITEESLDHFHVGFTRMDVLASPLNLRLIVQGHGVNECVPWHSHDNISDTFFCVSGYARIATRDPDHTYELAPGETCQVPPGIPHFVSGIAGEPCVLLVLQGVGVYNYVAHPSSLPD